MSRLGLLQDLLGTVFARGGEQRGGAVALPIDGALADPLAGEPFETLCDALLSERGEVSGTLLARALLARFRNADADGERAFFTLLAERFDLIATFCESAARRYAQSPDAAHLERLARSVEPRRQELFRRVNQVPGATEALVRLRERLFVHMREQPNLARIDVDLRHLFRSWFNPGFLELREIDWHTSATVLEKIIAYEAVHAISSWDALRERLQPPDRRCFAFFHPVMPAEPLIFVEVALTPEAPGSVRELLADDRHRVEASEARAAIFYSISNCQAGLAGISFGNFLIKRVVAELRKQLPALQEFRTLSPVPGLMRWVNKAGEPPASGVPSGESDIAPAPGTDTIALARQVAAGDGAPLDERERTALARLVADYLANAKRDDRQPVDPVARFHLGNGASLDRVLPEADRFRRGLDRSAGVMVSYLYDLDSIEANHEAYADERAVIVSSHVQDLLDPPSKRPRRAPT